MPSHAEFVAYLSFLIALLILAEQYFNSGVWFQVSDIHHETFSVGFVAFGLGILLGKRRGIKAS